MKTAVVLFNLGGPDAPAAVRPFLFNLFNDQAIIGLPNPFRWLLAKLISSRRAPVAAEIYERMGGRSPILPNTEAQAAALAASLGDGFECFIAMRYWHPRAADTARAVRAYAPDRVLLLPLYPQFSTTTTASSVKEWLAAAKHAGLTAPTQTLCCYPHNSGFVDSMVALIAPQLQIAQAYGTPRLLLSAHGLPEKIVKAGDPYQWQCEQSFAAIVAALRAAHPGLTFEPVLCYQSRVGPLQWITPATDDEVRRAGADKRAVVVAPLAFVSDHSETIVELGHEYRVLASECSVPFYDCVPAVGTHPKFIAGLAELVITTLQRGTAVCSERGHRICPRTFGKCPNQQEAA